MAVHRGVPRGGGIYPTWRASGRAVMRIAIASAWRGRGLAERAAEGAGSALIARRG
ncbi:hypothetical protein [Nonomuraea dietziae]|uniref:hypothetical protein n=1 Tax=Nonomuraea dietziae TaxID=65515 RepID=UPI0031E30C7F